MSENVPRKVESAIPKRRQDLLKWNGWGYLDSRFIVTNGKLRFTGSRYPAICGNIADRGVGSYIKAMMNTNLSNFEITDTAPMPSSFPEPKLNEAFVEAVKKINIDHSIAGEDRLMRCHGQTLHDIYSMRTGKFERIPDIVLWPANHTEVVDVVKLANDLDVVLIPFGGGTSVSGAVTCPQNELERCIAVLDMSQMNRLLWLNKDNLVACFEAGIVGQDMEKLLEGEGLTTGHEPDSYEFSTLGGWVATRASGMKKNVYGNIEDLVVQVRMVTSRGVLQRNISSPRVSCGPDFNQVIFGSEGSLGVVTEVQIKVRPLPTAREYDALVFPDFEHGVKFMREVAMKKCQPSSIRLLDNNQYTAGESLKLDEGLMSEALDVLKKFALTKLKGFDLTKLAVATALFEGDKKDVERQRNLIHEIANRHSGFSAGARNGKKGYLLTYVIGYLRDLLLDMGIVGESFETSVPWDKCEILCSNVKTAVSDACVNRGIEYFVVSCRVTQTYDAGACVYFYFGFRFAPGTNPVHTYEEIESIARDEILASGGSISHHHGVGKIRAKWFKQSVSAVGVELFKSTKLQLDPKNVFATGNFLTTEDEIKFEKPSAKL